MNAGTVDNVGTLKLKMLVMESIKEFPRGISDQAISLRAHDGECERSPGPGLKLQAASDKLQATSFKRLVKLQAASVECGPNRQAPSMAFRDDRTADRGSLYSHKVLCVHDRRLGL